MREFRLPSLGSDMDEGKLLEWKVRPGEAVKKGQVVAIVDTSKAAVDVEIWFEGTVSELVVQPGETVPVGTVLAKIEAAEEAAEIAEAAEPSEAAKEGGPAAAPQRPATPPPGGAARPQPAAAGTRAGRRRVSPAARKRAEELGVDLERIEGTGPDGAVTLSDVESAGEHARVLPKTVIPDDAKRRYAEMRRAIAAAMSRSKREIPHYYLSETIALRPAVDWLAAENARRPVTERLLMAVLQLKAVALAARAHPEMNGFFRDGAFEPAPLVHIGVAISLRQGGLIAPAIHDVAEKTLDELMRDLADLVRRARAGSLRSSEMSDPTLTVTNLGDQGVDTVHGVIYPPQVALVGFGRVAERPWASKGGLYAMPSVIASLAADHRASDGHRGGLFLAAIRDLMQAPEKL